jgi:MoxR-like ATPase
MARSRDAKRQIEEIRKAVGAGIVGQQALVDGLLAALIANGHVLVEGVPGLAKTRAVHFLARACRVDFKRLQFTPDLLPADIVGTQIYNRASGEFETRTGPVFTNFVLADEINRAAPKVQSALLEAMQERQVTIGPETHPCRARSWFSPPRTRWSRREHTRYPRRRWIGSS